MDPTNNMNHALEHVNVQQAPPHPPHQVVDAEDGGIHVVDHADVQAMMLDHPNSVNTMNHGVPPHHHQQQHHAAAAAATLQQHEEDDPAATNDPAEAERRRHRLAAQSIAAEAAANHKRRMEEQAAIDHLNEQLGEVGEESFHPKRKRSIRTYLQKKDRTRPPPEDLVSAWKTYETVRTEYDRLLAVTKIKEKKVQDAQAVVAQAQQELLQCHQEADLYQQTQVVKAKETVARLELEYHDSAWNAMFRKLEDYHAQHGNVDLPLRSKEDPELDKLCVWVTRQRSRKVDHDKKVREGKYKKKRHIGLERKEYQFDMLEKLGVRWSRKQDNWLARYDDLLKFKQEFGHCNVPQHYKANPGLAGWVIHTRDCMLEKKRGKKNALTDERIKMLEDAGFVWNMFDEKWKQLYQKLLAFHKLHGHINVPDNYPDAQLTRFVKRQREEFMLYQDEETRKSRKCRLTEDRIKLLNDIGMAWFV